MQVSKPLQNNRHRLTLIAGRIRTASEASLASSTANFWKIILKPSIALDQKRAAVREAPARFRATNQRIFGSVLHGTDKDGRDLDVLVDALPGAALFDLGGLQIELEDLLGVSVGNL